MMQAYGRLSPGYYDLIVADESHGSMITVTVLYSNGLMRSNWALPLHLQTLLITIRSNSSTVRTVFPHSTILWNRPSPTSTS